MLGVHLFDDWKLGNIAAGQMKLHRSRWGTSKLIAKLIASFLAIKRLLFAARRNVFAANGHSRSTDVATFPMAKRIC
jgi:hypothetical protein